MNWLIAIFALINLIMVGLQLVGLPGATLEAIAIFIFGIITGFSKFSIWIGLLILFIGIASGFLEEIGAMFGAKRRGASKWGMLGAIVGAIVGLLSGNLLVVILLTVAGAAVVEYAFNRREWNEALNMGIGALIGLATGYIAKAVIAVILFIWFLILVL
jgi:uncharacterized protein YqgC (DUF456 family)